MRAMIAMSGGVDSSVAALLMKEAGYDCTGVTMRLYRENGYPTSCEKSCCSDADEEYAAFVCWQLGIAHESMCFSKSFEQAVIRRFIREYEAGRTPNPCIDCNRFLKFDALLEQAKKAGYDILVTGHYARIAYSEELRRWQLFKAVDEKKDQSYVLYMLTQEQLRYLRFPLGALHKSKARQLAQAHKLVNAEKRDSQDICFIPDGDYAEFIRLMTGKRYPDGDILDQNGNKVGRHQGLLRYTIGQRRGLGFAAGEPRYVIGKDTVSNTLLIGPESVLYRRDLLASAFNWLSIPKPDAPIRAFARTRYHQRAAACTVYPLPGDEVCIVFDEPQRAITPGQAVVLYHEDMVLGGGTIMDFPTGTLVNAYTKEKEGSEPTIAGTQNLINESDILFIEPDKKRTDTWLDTNWLQLPLFPGYDPIKKVTLLPRDVNGCFSSGTQEKCRNKISRLSRHLGESFFCKITCTSWKRFPFHQSEPRMESGCCPRFRFAQTPGSARGCIHRPLLTLLCPQ